MTLHEKKEGRILTYTQTAELYQDPYTTYDACFHSLALLDFTISWNALRRSSLRSCARVTESIQPAETLQHRFAMVEPYLEVFHPNADTHEPRVSRGV